MKILAWYCVIIVVIALLGEGYNLVNPDVVDKATNYWGLILFIPVAYYLIVKATKE